MPDGPPEAPRAALRAAASDAGRLSRGLLLAATIAAAAGFLGAHYGAPAMLFALLIGMAFNFLAEESAIKPGIDFASKTVLRIGVALLGLRLTASDVVGLGAAPVLGVVALVALTIGAGQVVSRLLGRGWRFGLLTGGSVAICGASAALAIAAVLPRDAKFERDTLFTVVAVTTLSTVAMVAYPLLFAALDATEAEIGFLIGATIHDVAQVVGAGYSVSETAGDVAVLTKLQRVALLPVVLIAIVAARRSEGERAALPWFVVAFVALMAANSLGLAPEALRDAASEGSRAMLLCAIAALGVRTSIKALAELGGRYVAVVVLETLILLAAAIGFVEAWRLLG